MSNYVKLVGTKNPHVDNTSEYLVGDEKDPTRVVKGEPVQLGAEDKKKLEALGAVFEDSSADEHKEFEANRPPESLVGGDSILSGPVLSGGASNQAVDNATGTDQSDTGSSSSGVAPKTNVDKK